MHRVLLLVLMDAVSSLDRGQRVIMHSTAVGRQNSSMTNEASATDSIISFNVNTTSFSTLIADLLPGNDRSWPRAASAALERLNAELTGATTCHEFALTLSDAQVQAALDAIFGANAAHSSRANLTRALRRGELHRNHALDRHCRIALLVTDDRDDARVRALLLVLAERNLHSLAALATVFAAPAEAAELTALLATDALLSDREIARLRLIPTNSPALLDLQRMLTDLASLVARDPTAVATDDECMLAMRRLLALLRHRLTPV